MAVVRVLSDGGAPTPRSGAGFPYRKAVIAMGDSLPNRYDTDVIPEMFRPTHFLARKRPKNALSAGFHANIEP